ncbi:MAG: DASS family sodium-coupled anion symporter [Deferrisomatales bacterium]
MRLKGADRAAARPRAGWTAVALALPTLASLAPPGAGLTRPAQGALGVFGMAVVLWMSGAVPLPVTGLLILAALPLFGVLPAAQAFALFGNPAVFFILGAFILAAALMATGLSRRLSLVLLARFGATPRRLSTGVLATCALLSCAVPEHAVAALMFPTVSAVVEALRLPPLRSRFAVNLYLSMAWGCVTGGIATLLGGARVPLALGILDELAGRRIDFVSWSVAVGPLAALLACAAWLAIQFFFPPEIDNVDAAREILAKERERAGPPSPRERRAGAVALATVAAWVFVGDSVGMAPVALLSAFALFAWDVLTWREVEAWVNWGVILMYGGAIALGGALTRTGAAAWLARGVLDGVSGPPWLFLAAAAAATLGITELVSNAAAVAVVLPVALSVAAASGVDPVLTMYAVAAASGLTFTLPVGSPPNAIALSSGYYTTRRVALPGVLLSAASLLALAAAAWGYWPRVQ